MTENIFVSFSQCGQPEQVLEVRHAPLSEPRAGEMRVRLLFSPINPADINFIQGVYGQKPQFPAPQVGLEGCGRVEVSHSADFAAGDTVILLSGIGTWSRYLTAPSSCFLKLNAAIPSEQAAMLKVNPLTALRLLSDFVSLQPGDWIVQNAANSGVGRCVIQIARLMGLKTINFVRRSQSRLAELMALGADLVVDEEEPDVIRRTLATIGESGRPLLAANAVGGDSALRLMDLLAPGGTLVTYGAMSRQSLKVPNSFLIFKDIQLKGLWVTRWLEQASRAQVEATYSQLAAWMANGGLVQTIDSIYPLTQVRTAVARAQQEFRSGKVLLDLAN